MGMHGYKGSPAEREDRLRIQKHTARETEREFAAKLSAGDVFAISSTTRPHHINAALTKRGLYADMFGPRKQTAAQRKAWARHHGVYRVTEI